MTHPKKLRYRIASMLLALLLCISMAGVFAVPAKADWLSGDWEKVKIDTYNVYAYVLDTKLTGVTSFYLEMDVTMKAGARCENWDVWIRSSRGGSFEKIGYIYLEGGTGEASKTIRLSSVKNIDAIAVTPDASGSYSWTMSMGINNPTYASSSSSSSDSKSWATTSSQTLSGDWESVKIDDYNVHALVLDSKLTGVTSFQLDMEVTMKAGARCENWDVWARSSRSGSFKKIGYIYLDGGTGEASKTIRLSSPMTIDAVAVTPDASGSFSWTMGMTLSNPGYDTDSGSSSSSGGYLDGSWQKDTVYGDGKTYNNTYVFVLDEPVSCQHFDLYVNIDMNANTSCKNWHVYVRSNGNYYHVEELYLPNGTGSAGETIHMPKVRKVDAVAVLPVADGSFSWTISIGICNPE